MTMVNRRHGPTNRPSTVIAHFVPRAASAQPSGTPRRPGTQLHCRHPLRLARSTGSAPRALLASSAGSSTPLPRPQAFTIYPHTSNWDFPIGVLFRQAAGIKAQWMGKASLFSGPLGPLMRALGGLAIDRTAAHGVTAEIIDTYRRRTSLWLAITRDEAPRQGLHLKSGSTARRSARNCSASRSSTMRPAPSASTRTSPSPGMKRRTSPSCATTTPPGAAGIRRSRARSASA